MPEPTLIFVPTPGDHYSLATGSATMSVVHELVRQHIAVGGEARIMVGDNTRHDIPDGKSVEVQYPAPRSREKKIVDVGLGRVGLPRVFEGGAYRSVVKAIDPNEAPVVIVYNAPGGAAYIKRHRPHALVCLHAVNALFRTYNRPELRRLINRIDRILCCSKYIADDIVSRLGEESTKIRVVHNGVNTGIFQPRPPEVEGGVARILFIGRVVPQKGPDLLLKAARLIHGKVPPFQVRLVGSKNFALISELSPYEKELRDIAGPIQDLVDFHPSISRDRLSDEYHSASIFCAPSNWDDPLPLTVLEAMANGLAVVSSRRGGIPEGGGEDILYFSPPNVEELAERLAFFLQNAQVRAQWGARARARALTFDWKQQYQSLRNALN